MRRALGALGAVIVSVSRGRRLRGRGAPPAAPRAGPAAGARPAAVPRSREAEPRSLALEDRRAFDAPARSSRGAASPDAAVRARTALAARPDRRRARAPGVLSRLLADRSPDVARSAAFGRGHPRGPRDVAGLVPAARGSRRQGRRAGGLVAGLPGAARTARDALLGRPLAAAPRRPAGPALLFALWRYPDARRRSRPRSPTSPTRTPATRAAALYALARRPHEASLPALHDGASGPRRRHAAALAPARSGSSASRSRSSRCRRGARRPPASGHDLRDGSRCRRCSRRPRATPPPDKPRDRVLALGRRESQPRGPGARAPASWRARPRAVPAAVGDGLDRHRPPPAGRRCAPRWPRCPSRPRQFVDSAMASADPFLRGAAAESLGFSAAGRSPARRAKLMADPEVGRGPREGARGHRQSRGDPAPSALSIDSALTRTRAFP